MRSPISFLTVWIAMLLGGVAIGNASAATLIPFVDRASWEAAVGAFTEEDFDGFTTGVSYEAAAVDVGDFSVSVTGSTFGFSFHNVGPAIIPNDVNGTPQINAATGEVGHTTLAFDFPIVAFGADWDGTSDARTTNIRVGTEELSLPNLEPGFYGFVSDMPFTEVELYLAAGDADGFALDNAVYSRKRGDSVPDGGSSFMALAMSLFALLGASWKRRRGH